MRAFTKRVILVIVSLVSIMNFFSGGISVLAKDAPSYANAPSKASVYKGMPAGIDASQYMISPATYQDGTANDEITYKANSPEYGNPYDLFEMMQYDGETTSSLSNPPQVVSSIWGKRSSDPGGTAGEDNYFDLTKHQTISAWIYFGDKDAYKGLPLSDTVNTNTGLPDGMAFVLQDDARGSQAISTAVTSKLTPKKAGFGESLGVWGMNDSNLHGNTTGFNQADGAIHNSLAVEFDTAQNNRPMQGGYLMDNFFDGMTYNGSQVAKGQHMAWNYPDGDTNFLSKNQGVTSFDPNSSINKIVYTGNFLKGTGYYYGMNHRDVRNGMSITGYGDAVVSLDNSWQNFTFTYDPPTDGTTTAHMSYVLNNKKYDGTIRPSSSWNAVNNATINIAPLMARGNTKVRWGFTAGSGSTNSIPLILQ